MNLAQADNGADYQAHRQQFETRSLIDAARARGAQASPEAQPQGEGKQPALEVKPLETGGFGAYRDGVMVGGGADEASAWETLNRAAGGAVSVVKDVGKALVTGDMAKQTLFGGPADAARNALGAIDSMAAWLNENVADLTIMEPSELDKMLGKDGGLASLVPDVDPARTVSGGVARGVSQFLVGFLPMLRGLKAATGGTAVSALGKAAQIEGAAAAAGALVLDPQEERLSNIIQQVPALQNPVTEYLAAQPGDSEAEGRFKNAVESLGFGAATEGFVRGVGALRAMRRAKSAAPPEEAQTALYGAVPERDLILLGDPNAPLLEIKPREPDALGSSRRARKLADGMEQTKGIDTAYTAESMTAAARTALGPPVDEASMAAARREWAEQGGRSGPFGPIYDDLAGDWSKGLARLLQRQDGEIPAALNHPDIGPIDVVWGDSQGGLRHIVERHPEVLERLPELLAAMKVQTRSANRIRLESPDHLAVVRLDYDGKAKSWLLTAFERRRAPDATVDGQAASLGRADTAPPARSASVDIGDQRVFINFARINAPEDVKEVMGQMAEAFSGTIDRARRGVQSNAETQKLADELGMTVGDILNRRRGQPFNAEEALAARNLWAASAAKLKEIAERAASPNAGPVDQYNFRKMMAIHYAIQAEVIGARTETARALQAWSIPAGGDVENARAIQQLMEAMGGPDVSKAMAQRIAALKDVSADAMNAVVRKGWAATSMDAVKEAYVMGLLWSPATHIVNTGSNLGVAFQQIYERAAAAKIARAIGREAGDGVVEGEATAMAYGMVMATRDAFRLAARALRTGETGASLGKVDLPHDPAISSEAFAIASDSGLGRTVDFIGAVTRAPGRLLGAEDEFFKTIGYRMELHAQALRQATGEGLKGKELGERIADILANPPEHIRIAAADAALYNTFTSQAGSWARALMNLRNGGELNPTFMVLPFVRTPANILRYSFERTPLAPLVGQWRADIAAGGARADLALARMATGSTIMMLTVDFALSGLISGAGPKDAGEREALIRQGWQPYSFKVGDKWYSYKRTDPFGMLMGFSADMTEALARGDIDPEDMDEWQEVMAGAIAAVANTVVDKTYFSGVSNVIEAMSDPQRFAPSYINNLAGSFVPFTTALGTASRLTDPTAREINTPWDAVMAKLPGLASRLTPKRDLWGREIKPDAVYGSGFDVLSPMAVRETKDSPIDAEMTRLNMDVRRIAKKTTLAGEDVNLRDFPEAYDELVRLAGNELKHPAWNLGAKDYLDAVVSGKHPMSQAYQILSDGKDGGKANFIKSAIQEYRAMAAELVLERHPEIAEIHAAKREKKMQQRMPVLQ